jgi:flagellar motor switch protein FliN/FliY
MSDESERIKQDEIEELLKQSQGGDPSAAPDKASSSDDSLGQGEIEALMKDGPTADSSSPAPAGNDDDADKVLGQAEIESLLSGAAPAKKPAAKQTAAARAAAQDERGDIAQGDIELLIQKAEKAIESVKTGLDPAVPDALARYQFEDFAGAEPSSEVATLDLLRDVELDLRIELGRTNLYLEDVLRLRKGSVVPLDKLAGDPVDVYVNGRLIARGEVLVLNDNFCVRVAELVVGESLVH